MKSAVQRMRAFSMMARSRSWSMPAAAAEVSRCLLRVRLLGLAAMRSAASSWARAKDFGGDDFGDEAEVHGDLCVDDAAGEEKIARALFADLARQKDGDDRGEEADFDFGVAEFRFGGGEGEIAERGDAAAAGVGGAVDGGDHRAREGPDAAEKFCDAAGVFLIFGGGLRGERGELVEIHAGAEGFAGAGEDDDAGGVIFFDGVERGLDVGDHLRARWRCACRGD